MPAASLSSADAPAPRPWLWLLGAALFGLVALACFLLLPDPKSAGADQNTATTAPADSAASADEAAMLEADSPPEAPADSAQSTIPAVLDSLAAAPPDTTSVVSHPDTGRVLHQSKTPPSDHLLDSLNAR